MDNIKKIKINLKILKNNYNLFKINIKERKIVLIENLYKKQRNFAIKWYQKYQKDEKDSFLKKIYHELVENPYFNDVSRK